MQKYTKKRFSSVFIAWLPYTVIIVALVVIALNIVSMMKLDSVWDDSFMTYRYAHNLLETGQIVWDVGGEHTYGPTSLALVPVVALFALFLQSPVLVLLMSGIAGAAVFVFALYVLARHAFGFDKETTAFCLASCFTILAYSHSLVTLATTGMDTLFSMAYLTEYIALAVWVERSAYKPSYAYALGVTGGLVLLVRPDLMLFTVLIPLATALVAETPNKRKNGMAALASTIITLVVVAALLFLYFKTVVPLSFYTKATGMYGPTLAHQFVFVPILQLIAFIDLYKLVFLGAAAWALFQFRSLFRREGSAVLKGVAVAAAGYIVYFLFFVIQIMHMSQRFYHPALPALLALACGALAMGVRYVRTAASERFATAAIATVSAVLLVSLYTPLFQGLQRLAYAVQKDSFHYGIERFFADNGEVRAVWPCLDVVSSRPEGGTIAGTESGFPSVFNLNNTMVDLSGLHDNDIIMNGFSADRIIEKRHPDLIYVPYRHYKEMHDEMESSALFKEQYEFFSRADLGSFSDVGIRKDSPHYRALQQCFRNRIAEHLPVIDDSKDVIMALPYPLE